MLSEIEVEGKIDPGDALMNIPNVGTALYLAKITVPASFEDGSYYPATVKMTLNSGRLIAWSTEVGIEPQRTTLYGRVMDRIFVAITSTEIKRDELRHAFISIKIRSEKLPKSNIFDDFSSRGRKISGD